VWLTRWTSATHDAYSEQLRDRGGDSLYLATLHVLLQKAHALVMWCLLGYATVATNFLSPCTAKEKGIAMRWFAGEGRNAQEGRKVIPAPRRNGEEEAPHGLRSKAERLETKPSCGGRR
jgi:hypothetical protein